jgi:hypothetical protein
MAVQDISKRRNRSFIAEKWKGVCPGEESEVQERAGSCQLGNAK